MHDLSAGPEVYIILVTNDDRRYLGLIQRNLELRLANAAVVTASGSPEA